MTRAALCLVLACAACVRYTPRPLDAPRHPAEVLARDLSDSALVAGVAAYAGRPEGNRWTDRQLAVAALRLRSDLRRKRAEWRAAAAALRTAGERAPLGVRGELERRVGGRGGESPWVVAVGGLFALELGGKRGARLQAARAAMVVAEARLLAAAWGAASDARRAAAGMAHAAGEVADMRDEIRVLEVVQDLERARFAEAALGTSELARTSTEIQAARVLLAAAERGVLETRATLAAALAVPVRAVESVDPVLPAAPGCAALTPPATDSLIASALARRHEVALALGEYALAESQLRLQVARQYPDLELGPGFVWDQGVHRWTLALAVPALLGSRNRGAIGEAEAAREVAGLKVAEAQDAVLADIEAAVQRCRGAALEVAAADSVVAAAARLAERERAAYQRGETSRLEPARADLLLARAAVARRRAERHLALAALDIDRSAGGRSPPAGDWPDPRQDPDEEATPP